MPHEHSLSLVRIHLHIRDRSVIGAGADMQRWNVRALSGGSADALIRLRPKDKL